MARLENVSRLVDHFMPWILSAVKQTLAKGVPLSKMAVRIAGKNGQFTRDLIHRTAMDPGNDGEPEFLNGVRYARMNPTDEIPIVITFDSGPETPLRVLWWFNYKSRLLSVS